MKQVLDSIKLYIFPALIRLLFRLIALTCRVRVVDEGGAQWLQKEAVARGRLFANWHQHLLFAVYFIRQLKLFAMISLSRDGEYFVRLIAGWGYRFIRGSSSRGGAEAYAEAVELLKSSGGLWIAPDGPRGPAHVVKWGVGRMLLETGSIVIPMGFAYSRKIRLKSWDQCQIILPFSKIVVVLGKPYEAEGTMEEERIKAVARELELRLEAVTNRAEELLQAKLA